jgi:hypothetical protein
MRRLLKAKDFVDEYYQKSLMRPVSEESASLTSHDMFKAKELFRRETSGAKE